MGSFIGQLDLTVDGGTVTNYKFNVVGIDESRFKENREVKTLIDKEQAPFAKRLTDL
jgi:hypothetical protein